MGLCQKHELKAPQVPLWDRSCPSSVVSPTPSSGGDGFPQKSQVSWCAGAKRAAVLSCLIILGYPLPCVSAFLYRLLSAFPPFHWGWLWHQGFSSKQKMSRVLVTTFLFLEALVQSKIQPEATLFASLFPVYPLSWRSLFSLGEREEEDSISTAPRQGYLVWAEKACSPQGNLA